MATRARASLAVAVGGLGAIGRAVAERLDAGIPGLTLAAVSARDVGRAERTVARFARPVPVLPLSALAGVADVVVECAPAAVFRQVAEPAVRAGRVLVAISVGALLSALDLVDLAREHGGQIVVPSGAILGLDAVTAAAEGRIERVRMVTRKPVAGLVGAPYLAAHGIDLTGLTEARCVFRGSAKEGAAGFPANVNVAAALGLAGIGPERTELEIWADPACTRNTHAIEVVADAARFSMTIEGVPSEANPRTGRLTPLSVIAALRKVVGPLRIGT